LEQREYVRYGVRALVDFEWIQKGGRHRGRGLTRDINSKGMFVYSGSQPPVTADLQVEVTFRPLTEAQTNLRLSAKALVVRVESSATRNAPGGFAILIRSYNLHNGLAFIDAGDWD
jgi:hypothetical protein